MAEGVQGLEAAQRLGVHARQPLRSGGGPGGARGDRGAQGLTQLGGERAGERARAVGRGEEDDAALVQPGQAVAGACLAGGLRRKPGPQRGVAVQHHEGVRAGEVDPEFAGPQGLAVGVADTAGRRRSQQVA